MDLGIREHSNSIMHVAPTRFLRLRVLLALNIALWVSGCTPTISVGTNDASNGEDSPATCCDGIDNDGDSLTDLAEPSCFAFSCVGLDGGPDARDGFDVDAGPPPVCGDTVHSSVEECEDGNLTDGDGCSSSCELESSICGGVPLHHLRVGSTGVGDTSGTLNHTQGTCGGAFAGEDAWAFTLPRTARVKVSLSYSQTDPALHAAMYVRNTCDISESETACGVHASEYPLSYLVAPADSSMYLDPGTHFAFVDGIAGESGQYEIGITAQWFAKLDEPCGFDPSVSAFVSCIPGLECQCPAGATCPSDSMFGSTCVAPEPSCGNGIVETGEECDTPPGSEFTTCTPDCHLLQLDCTPLAMLPLVRIGEHMTGSTVGHESHFVSPLCPGGLLAPDTAFHLHIDEGGVVVRVRLVRPGTDFNAVFSMNRECAANAFEFGARETMCGSDEYVVLGALDAGDYYLYIDGVEAAAGNFDFVVDVLPQVPNGAACVLDDPITLPAFESAQHRCASNFCYDAVGGPVCADFTTVPPHTCGNSVLEWPELCEDGNTMDGDGCNSACFLPTEHCQSYSYPTLDPTMHSFGSTAGQPSTVDCACGGSRSGDDGYLLNVEQLSRVVVSANYPATDFATVIDVRNVCAPARSSDEVQCAANNGVDPAFVRVPRMQAGQYVVYVDGLYGATGNYELGAWVLPLVGPGEACLPDYAVPDGIDNCAESSTRCHESGVGTYTCQ